MGKQGPKLEYMSLFWQMVFQESKDVGVVIMLTQTHEAGSEKCSLYFPVEIERSPIILRTTRANQFASDSELEETNGGILGKVTLLESAFNDHCGCEVRKLQLTVGRESKIVWHYLYVCWPDFSKPEAEDRAALINLIKESSSKCSSDNPRVVHCSAGVGRTGTFIALDHLLKELESGELLKITNSNTDPVFETVNRLREQRMMMVHNEMQLQFIYEVLREQADLMLGNVTEEELRSGLQNPGCLKRKSTKTSHPSSPDSQASRRPEAALEPTSSRASTPRRSWSGTPEVSDNE